MGLLGDIGGIVGGFLDRDHANKMASVDRDFQREVYQNQLQWKVADAKKAGLHPLAVLGTGSYSASPSSVPSSSSFADSFGKLGESIGDLWTAHMNKDEIAKAVKKKQDMENRQIKMEDESHAAEMQVKNSMAQYYGSMAMEAARRSLSYTRPRATGREYIPGQTNSGNTSISHTPDNPTYAVRPMGNNKWDINFSQEYQQEIGDELGQVVNALKSYRRAGGTWNIFKGPKDGTIWKEPGTNRVFRYDKASGYWDKIS